MVLNIKNEKNKRLKSHWKYFTLLQRLQARSDFNCKFYSAEWNLIILKRRNSPMRAIKLINNNKIHTLNSSKLRLRLKSFYWNLKTSHKHFWLKSDHNLQKMILIIRRWSRNIKKCQAILYFRFLKTATIFYFEHFRLKDSSLLIVHFFDFIIN